jgi:hypothetical protein
MRKLPRAGHGRRDRAAALARETSRQRIAEERVGPLTLHRAVARNPDRRVGHVVDLVVGHRCHGREVLSCALAYSTSVAERSSRFCHVIQGALNVARPRKLKEPAASVEIDDREARERQSAEQVHDLVAARHRSDEGRIFPSDASAVTPGAAATSSWRETMPLRRPVSSVSRTSRIRRSRVFYGTTPTASTTSVPLVTLSCTACRPRLSPRSENV